VIGEADAHEVSLAENVVRLAMHPADQFEAFQALAGQGKGVEEIAARFGVTPAIVRQRLKLASVSPVLVALYRDGEMNLDQLMAFTVSDDPEAQERVWFEQRYNRSPHAIRAALTAEQVEADDRRVRFVGVDAYLAAGGGMNRDLFQPEHDGYLTDPALLDRLVSEKLEAAAATVRAEGWSWVEIMIQRDYAALQGFRRIQPETQPLGMAEQERRDALAAEYDALIEEHGEEPEGEAEDRLSALA
jgi:ParB family chromosome partitioning protein